MKQRGGIVSDTAPFDEQQTMEWNIFNARRERRPARPEAPGQHEDNLSRALFITWRALAAKGKLAAALRKLGRSACFDQLVGAIAENETAVKMGTQGLPPMGEQELRATPRMVVGISSSRGTGSWSFDQRKWPTRVRPDGWIYLPGQALLVFEAKTADHALDATQILAYCAELGLASEDSAFPFPEPGRSLSAEAARHYQAALQPRILDSTWTDALRGIRSISDADLDPVTRFVVSHCDAYMEDNRFVPWADGCFAALGRLDSPRKVDNGRFLLGRLGKELELQGYEATTKLAPVVDQAGESTNHWRTPLGASGFPYLSWRGPDLEADLGSSPTFCLNLGEDKDALFTFELYLEAPGANTPVPSRNDVEDGETVKGLVGKWTEARQRHRSKGKLWLKALTRCDEALEISIGAVKFKGKNVLWRGSEKAPEIPDRTLSIKELREQGWKAIEPYWCFEEAPEKATVGDLRLLARQVRKPAISLLLPHAGSDAPTPAELEDAFGRLGSRLAV